MGVFHQLCTDKCHENEWNVDTLLQGLVPGLVTLNWITHVSIFLTILSMSDCLGMCLWIIDNGVSIGTSAWGICVYLISGGEWC